MSWDMPCPFPRPITCSKPIQKWAILSLPELTAVDYPFYLMPSIPALWLLHRSNINPIAHQDNNDTAQDRAIY